MDELTSYTQSYIHNDERTKQFSLLDEEKIMFPKKLQTDANKNDFLQNLDEAREARRREKQVQHAVIIIQKTYRGYLVRKKYRNYRK